MDNKKYFDNYLKFTENFDQASSLAYKFMKTKYYEDIINGTIPYYEQLFIYGYPIEFVFDKQANVYRRDDCYYSGLSVHLNYQIQKAMALIEMGDIKAAKTVLRRVQYTIHNHIVEKPNEWIPDKARTPKYSAIY